MISSLKILNSGSKKALVQMSLSQPRILSSKSVRYSLKKWCIKCPTWSLLSNNRGSSYPRSRQPAKYSRTICKFSEISSIESIDSNRRTSTKWTKTNPGTKLIKFCSFCQTPANFYNTQLRKQQRLKNLKNILQKICSLALIPKIRI